MLNIIHNLKNNTQQRLTYCMCILESTNMFT